MLQRQAKSEASPSPTAHQPNGVPTMLQRQAKNEATFRVPDQAGWQPTFQTIIDRLGVESRNCTDLPVDACCSESACTVSCVLCSNCPDMSALAALTARAGQVITCGGPGAASCSAATPQALEACSGEHQ